MPSIMPAPRARTFAKAADRTQEPNKRFEATTPVFGFRDHCRCPPYPYLRNCGHEARPRPAPSCDHPRLLVERPYRLNLVDSDSTSLVCSNTRYRPSPEGASEDRPKREGAAFPRLIGHTGLLPVTLAPPPGLRRTCSALVHTHGRELGTRFFSCFLAGGWRFGEQAMRMTQTVHR